MTLRILIAGGYGLVGGHIARHIRAAGHDAELLLAGRNPELGEPLAQELGHARAIRLDVANPGPALADLGAIDLIISALKDPADALIDAALRAGVAHIGITKTCDELGPVLFATRDARPRRPIVMLGHWQAGVMTLVAMKAAESFAHIETVETAALYDSLDPIGPMTAGDSEGFFGRALLRRAGAWLWVDPEPNGRHVSRRDQSGFDALPMGVLDVASLAAMTGAADVRFDLAVGDSLGTQAGGVASHDIYIDMTGVLLSGRRGRVRTVISDPRGQAQLTAVGVLVIAERVLGLDGRPRAEGGLCGPEALVSADQAISRFQAFGVRIEHHPMDAVEAAPVLATAEA
ncbi:hypothetical protein [Phenylobacterium sp.]|uniref:hypothetical protein n=1 Tax=Phenylobacterium sp. TaxID=1871053 RepID=UPI0030F3B31E